MTDKPPPIIQAEIDAILADRLRESRASGHPGFVYLLEEVPMRDEVSGPWTKVGFSKNPPEWRLQQNMKSSNPRLLRFGAIYEFQSILDALAAEAAVHRHFHALRVPKKEWLNLPWQQVAIWCEAQGYQRRKGYVVLPVETDPIVNGPPPEKSFPRLASSRPLSRGGGAHG